MPTIASNKEKANSNNSRSSPTEGTSTRLNTRRNGTSTLIEDLQDIKDPLEGRKYLEKHSLLCPPGEPPTHTSLATCLHQISGLAGVQKPVINTIRAVAFLLEEMEDTHINEVVRDALDVQLTEFTTDMKEMIEHAKSKIDEHIKEAEDRLKIPVQPQAPAQYTQATTSYASVLVSLPAHANPRIAAREGIKARQFMIEGIKNLKFSHLDTLQLKIELNKIFINIGLISGKIRSITNIRNGGVIIEMDSDNATKWISNKTTQDKICEDIGANMQFIARVFNVIAFNVPLALDTYQLNTVKRYAKPTASTKGQYQQSNGQRQWRIDRRIKGQGI